MDKKCNYSQLQNPPQYRSCFERNTGSSSSECETRPNLVGTEHVNCPEQSGENIKEPLLPAVTCDERFGVKNKNWATNKSIACRTAKQPNISNVKPANKRIVKHSNDPTMKQSNRRYARLTSSHKSKQENSRTPSFVKENGNNIKKSPAKPFLPIPFLPSYKKRKKATISHKLSPQDRNLNQFRNRGVRTNDHLNEVHNSRSAIKNPSRSLSRSRKSLSIYSIDSGLRMNLDAKGKEKNNLSSSSKIKRQSTAVAKPASGTTRPTSAFRPASGLKIDSVTNILRMESETHLKYLRSDVDAQSNPKKHKTGNYAKYNNKLNDFSDTTAKTETTKTKNPQTYSSNRKARKPPAKTRMKQERNIKAPSLASRLKKSTSSIKPIRVSCQEREGCEPCIKESKNDGIRSRSKLSSNGSKVKIKKNKSPSKEEKSKTYKKRPKTISHTASITSSDSGSQASSRQSERKRRNRGNKQRGKSKTSALSSNSGNSNSTQRLQANRFHSRTLLKLHCYKGPQYV